MNISFNAYQLNVLIQFLNLLQKWNRSYNLTAVESLEDMVTRHLLDSASIVPYLTGHDFIDVGTGAGLPGIPLAILMPDKNFVLLDSNTKRTRFLLQVVSELKLPNVGVVASRVEAYVAEKTFDGVISRAFSSLAEMLEKCENLCSINGRLYAMKGLYPEKELRQIEKGINVEHCYRLSMPGEQGERHLLVLQKTP